MIDPNGTLKEIFVDMPEFEDYLISNCGRAKTKSRKLRYTHAVTNKEHFRVTSERFLKLYDSVHGYKFIQPRSKLNKIPKNKTIHRLVAKAFVPNPNNYPVVNHIDGNKHNNTALNLEWCTDAYNHEHATKTGLIARGSRTGGSILNENSVDAIRNMLKDGVVHSQIAKWFSVSRSTVHLIGQGKTWKHSLTGQ